MFQSCVFYEKLPKCESSWPFSVLENGLMKFSFYSTSCNKMLDGDLYFVYFTLNCVIVRLFNLCIFSLDIDVRLISYTPADKWIQFNQLIFVCFQVVCICWAVILISILQTCVLPSIHQVFISFQLLFVRMYGVINIRYMPCKF